MSDALHTLAGYLHALVHWLGRQALEFVKDHPWAAAAAAYAVARMFGTVIETGWRGVLFSFGQAKRELEPGFHWLAPIVHRVRKVRVRSVSLDLPPQRIVARDGLAYDVDANVVYHIADPTAAVVQVDDVHGGCRTVVPLVIAALLRERDSRQLADRSRLDGELAAEVQARVARWGVVVEHAGLQSIAPTRETLRLTQLRCRIEERARLFATLQGEGLAPEEALSLLGAIPRLVEKSVVRRRGYRRRLALSRRFANAQPPAAPAWKVGDRVLANWWGMGEYYPGVVTEIDGEFVHVKYDDGDAEVVQLRNLRREPKK